MTLPNQDSLQIEKTSLHDQVASRIRDLIIEGHLEPGSRIDEARLVDQLQVSRTPLREALRTLAAEGLIAIRPARGSVVRKWSKSDVSSMLEVLAELERLAGRAACERASDAEIGAARDLHQRMIGFYEAGDRLPYYKLNQEFHQYIGQLSRNETLCEMQGNIMARLKRIRFLGNSKPDHWQAAVADHIRMIEALEARDGAELGSAMADHLDRTWDRVHDVI